MFPVSTCKIGTAYNTMYYMSLHFGYKNGIRIRIKRKVANITDSWEQRKFDEVVTRIGTGLNPRDNFVLNKDGRVQNS